MGKIGRHALPPPRPPTTFVREACEAPHAHTHRSTPGPGTRVLPTRFCEVVPPTRGGGGWGGQGIRVDHHHSIYLFTFNDLSYQDFLTHRSAVDLRSLLLVLSLAASFLTFAFIADEVSRQ